MIATFLYFSEAIISSMTTLFPELVDALTTTFAPSMSW